MGTTDLNDFDAMSSPSVLVFYVVFAVCFTYGLVSKKSNLVVCAFVSMLTIIAAGYALRSKSRHHGGGGALSANLADVDADDDADTELDTMRRPSPDTRPDSSDDPIKRPRPPDLSQDMWKFKMIPDNIVAPLGARDGFVNELMKDLPAFQLKDKYMVEKVGKYAAPDPAFKT